MPQYITKLLQQFQHPHPSRQQLSPHEAAPYIPMKKGQRQYAPSTDTSTLLNAKDTTQVQSIVGSLLYYARAINNTILPALNTIGSAQAKPTTQTMNKCNRLLDYIATFPNVFLRFRASNMILHIDSDESYLVAPEEKSRIAGFFISIQKIAIILFTMVPSLSNASLSDTLLHPLWKQKQRVCFTMHKRPFPFDIC